MAVRPVLNASTAAIVVTWNRADLLRAVIPSLLNQSLPFARVIVVDNGSRDDTGEWARQTSRIELVSLPVNRGFAAGCNSGIRCALEDSAIECVALINNDVVLDPDWHREAAKALLADPDHGCCATCLVKQSNPDVIDTAGMIWHSSGWADNYLPGRPLTELGNSIPEIFGACAAAALFRRAFFRDVGLFDESFFAYQEDVDLALRGRLHGWRCVLAPRARGIHGGFGSNRRFPIGGTYADYYNARNRIAVIAKSMPGGDWRRYGMRTLKAHLLYVLKSFPQRRAGATLAGTVHGILRLPRTLRARSAVFAARRHSAGPGGRGAGTG